MTPSSDWRLSVDTAIDVAKSWYIGNRAKEHLDQRTFTPMTFDVFQMNGLLFGGKSPWMVGQFLGKTAPSFPYITSDSTGSGYVGAQRSPNMPWGGSVPSWCGSAPTGDDG
jgi:hypothetical protein